MNTPLPGTPKPTEESLPNELLNSLPDAVAWLETVRDEQGAIVDFIFSYSNAKTQEVVGSTFRTEIGRQLLADNPTHRTFALQLFEQYREVYVTGLTKEYTYYNPITNAHFHVVRRKWRDGVLSITRDRTAEKMAESKALEHQNLLNAVINSSLTGMLVCRAVRDESGALVDFKVILHNQAAREIADYTEEQFTDLLLSELDPEGAAGGMRENYLSVLTTGQTLRLEYFFRHANRWLELSVVRLDAEQVIVSFLDVTRSKQIQHSLEQSANYLQTVIDTAQTGIFLFTPIRDDTGQVVDFRFRLTNHALAAYVGQEPATVTGALGSHWFPGYKTNGLFERYRHTYETGQTLRFDFHYNQDGIDSWLDIMSTRLGDEVLVTFSDFTPLKRLQQQLEASVIDLQRSNANLEQFAYVASHDLQEPLRKIQSFGDILQTQFAASLGEQGKDYIERMQTAAGRMQILIKDLLTYSRLTTLPQALRPVRLNDILESVLNDLETAIQKKGAQIRLENLPTVLGNSTQLRQLFQNLISNALKFTQTGREPLVVVRSEKILGADSRFTVAPADAQQWFHEITIADNGIGFDPKHATLIFQVFQRLHNRKEQPGTGIGLAIVQKVVDNHKGYIVAEGRPGEGATFRLLLPVPVAR